MKTTIPVLCCWRACLWLALCLPVLAGCSVSNGNGGLMTLFPQGGTLLPSADEIRRVNAARSPLDLPRELHKQPTPPYTVEPGDGVFVEPAVVPTDKEPEVILPFDEQEVLLDGTISLGRYGRVVVAGLTLEEIEHRVRAVVATYHGKDMGAFVARLTSPESKVYYVLGEVVSPGAYILEGRETVLDGLLRAGGLNSRASRGNIIVSRPTHPCSCRVVLPVCYEQIVQLGDTTTNYQLRPGDRIYVPARTCWENCFCNRRRAVCGRQPQCGCPLPSQPCCPGPGCAAEPAAIGEPLPAPLALPGPHADPRFVPLAPVE